MSRPFARIVQAMTDWAWPRTCFLCNGRVGDDRWHCVCGECEQKLNTDPPNSCPRCASTIGPHTDISNGCPSCRTTKFRFAGVTRLGVYDGLLRQAVLKVKGHGGDGLAETLGRLFALARSVQIRNANPEVVIPVPMHWRRLFGRGHNQAERIAAGIATELGLPLWNRRLRRVTDKPQHKARSREQRWANAEGAFRLSPWVRLPGVRVLLVDDVLTTGATADAAADALRRGGAAQVHVAVLAHR